MERPCPQCPGASDLRRLERGLRMFLGGKTRRRSRTRSCNGPAFSTLELGLRVLDTFNDASLLVAAFDKVQPDLILLHVYKPWTAGFEHARKLKATYPAIKMIVMTTNENPQIALDCMNSWASGYLLMKSAEELLQA